MDECSTFMRDLLKSQLKSVLLPTNCKVTPTFEGLHQAACGHHKSKNLNEIFFLQETMLGNPSLRDDTTVGNALITIYAKCNEIKSAFWAFSMILRKDLISWNAILDAYSQSGYSTQFFDLFHQMLGEEIRPDSITIFLVLHVVCSLSSGEKVKEAHGYSLRAALLPNRNEPTVGNAILDAYAKCGNMDYAFKTFESLSDKKNVVTGNTMLSGYVNCGSWEDAKMIFSKMSQKDLKDDVSLFHELQLLGMKPDMVSIMSVLPVCTHLASIHLVRQCHGYIVRSCFQDIRLGAALLDVYSKYTHKDLVMFTALVGGYAMHGMGEEALDVFHGMVELGIRPDHVIITAVLSACSHAGLIDEGLKIFDSINGVYELKPTMEHYACTVDLLARGGHLKDAYSFVTAMPIKANANVWGTLLGACRNQHKVELGCIVADHLFEVEANNIGNYVVISNIYAAGERWDGVKELRTLMKDKYLKKSAGCSWIEVECKRHVFVAGDSFHPERTNIYSTLGILDEQIRDPP